MLADEVRNAAYHRAISKYVKEGDVVVDLGTGTGILSFFAASKHPKKIYAIDHASIIEKARFTAERNQITCIEFINVNSKKFRIPEPADVIIHEQIGQYLFDENMVTNLIDLRERVLKRGGKILPSKFEFFIEPVTLKEEYRIPFLWEQKVHDVRFDALKDWVKEDVGESHYRRLTYPIEVDHFLCNPGKLVSFDLEKDRKGDLPRKVGYRKKVVKDGRLDGFSAYFVAKFDEEITFSNSPLSPRTSWGVPFFRVESKNYRQGDSIEFEITMGDIETVESWEWNYS